MTDESGWITKRDAATLAGVDERTIERKARAGKLTAKARPGFPTLYRAADVEKLAQTSAQEVWTGILEPGTAAGSNGNHTSDVSNTQIAVRLAADDPIRQLAALVVQALTHAPTGPTGPTVAPTGSTAAYVDKDEALTIAGVSYGELRKAVQAGEVKQRGRQYRRKDLEQL